MYEVDDHTRAVRIASGALRRWSTAAVRRRRPTRRLGARQLACLALLALLVAGCGDGDDDASTTAAQPETTAFPITIQHARGSTTIESQPTRVVTVGLKDQDTLLALGIKAVGAMDWFQQGTFAKWPWEDWGSEPPTVVSTKSGEINFEKVAGLRPDLILGMYQDISAGDYKTLAKIAPTVAQSADHEAYTTPWRDETLIAAEAVGKKQQGQELIDAVDAKFAAVRKEHPEFQGKTAIVLDAGQGDAFAFGSTDPRGQFLKELGFTNPPAIDKAVKGKFGDVISDERLDLIDVDYLFMLSDKTTRTKFFAKPVFKALDVVARGDVIELPYYDAPNYGAAMAFNTVLSIPYAIDGALKQFAARKRL